jgi:hypothetical protein
MTSSAKKSISWAKITNNVYFNFFLAIGLWLFCFREFIFGKLPFSSDASAYYEHIQLYVDNLLKGIYPLWDPHQQVPTEFFLRRFDSFNPFFSFLMLMVKSGIPYDQAYRLFLAAYFFLAMTGFYLLARRIWRDPNAAFVAFLLLTFSSFGTRIFDSYLIFMFTAMVWFFYFLVVFTQDLDRKALLGLTFCLMILVTTYIPFYFLIIFLMFLLSFVVVYFRESKAIVLRYVQFIRANKLFTVFCAIIFGLSLLVPLFFYQEAGRGEFVLPMRNANAAPGENALVVSLDFITWWGIIEDLWFSWFYMFANLPYFRSAIFYIPVFAYIAFILSLFTAINKRLLLFTLWGILLLFINLPLGTPIYSFLYNHVFIFKYFRNLHFFLWIILLPIFILIVLEQFRGFWSFYPKTQKEKVIAGLFLAVVHLGLLFFFYQKGTPGVASYAAILGSLILFASRFFAKESIRNAIGILPILAVIVVEPLQVYHYFTKNYQSPPSAVLSEEKRQEPAERTYPKPAQLKEPPPTMGAIYYGSTWFNILMQNIEPKIWDKYREHKFYAYDQVELLDKREVDFKRVEEVFWREENLAFITPEGDDQPMLTNKSVAPHRQIVKDGSKELKVEEMTANSVKLRTNFDVPKFLVYNDSFHTDWRAFLNGKSVKLLRTNVAFKGLWVPAGEVVVEFRFGTPAKYGFNIFMLAVFYSVLGAILGLYLKKKT